MGDSGLYRKRYTQNRHEPASPNSRDDWHPRRTPGTQLMTAPSGPGRTCRTLVPERQLRDLAGAVPAAVRDGRAGVHRLPGLAGMAAPALPPFDERPLDLLDQRDSDGTHDRNVGGIVVPIPVKLLALALAALMSACSSAPPSSAPAAGAGIRKVEAQVRGVT